MRHDRPMTDIIRQRYSCRTYQKVPIDPERRAALAAFVADPGSGPFGAPVRFCFVAAADDEARVLRRLSTYGFIRGATAFVVGATSPGPRSLEDFGFLMEEIILFATALGLGTCWLGGTFSKSGFAARIELREEEVMPAVTAVGIISEERTLSDRLVGRASGNRSRLPWPDLFFDGQFGTPLTTEAAGPYAGPLEMVRLAPSASNKQPWRVVRAGGAWHFFLERTPGYLTGLARRFVTADLQRVDLGIALDHFQRTAQDAGLAGSWTVNDPGLTLPTGVTEYVASWHAEC